MELITVFIIIFCIGLGIAVLGENNDSYQSSGCYRRSYHVCCRCSKKQCRYYKLSQTLEKMEKKEES